MAKAWSKRRCCRMEKYQCGGLNSIQYKFGACKPENHGFRSGGPKLRKSQAGIILCCFVVVVPYVWCEHWVKTQAYPMGYAKKVLKLHLKLMSKECFNQCSTNLLFLELNNTQCTLQKLQESGHLRFRVGQGLDEMQTPKGKQLVVWVSHSF